MTPLRNPDASSRLLDVDQREIRAAGVAVADVGVEAIDDEAHGQGGLEAVDAVVLRSGFEVLGERLARDHLRKRELTLIGLILGPEGILGLFDAPHGGDGAAELLARFAIAAVCEDAAVEAD